MWMQRAQEMICPEHCDEAGVATGIRELSSVLEQNLKQCDFVFKFIQHCKCAELLRQNRTEELRQNRSSVKEILIYPFLYPLAESS